MASQELHDERGTVPSVTADREEIRTQICTADGLLICLDYDGTLAPIVERPEDAAMLPACRRAIDALSDCSAVTLAVVSGRSLADVRERVGIEGIAYAGNHGLERAQNGERVVDPTAERARSQIERAVTRLRDELGDVPGCTVEDKGVTATVHYRQVSAERVPAIREAIDRVCEIVGDGIERTSGKQIVEIRPDTDRDKGTAVSQFVAENERTLPMYIGDDVTDQAAFDAVTPEGFAIHVGEEAPPEATHRLREVAHVANFLDWVREVEAGVL